MSQHSTAVNEAVTVSSGTYAVTPSLFDLLAQPAPQDAILAPCATIRSILNCHTIKNGRPNQWPLGPYFARKTGWKWKNLEDCPRDMHFKDGIIHRGCQKSCTR